MFPVLSSYVLCLAEAYALNSLKSPSVPFLERGVQGLVTLVNLTHKHVTVSRNMSFLVQLQGHT